MTQSLEIAIINIDNADFFTHCSCIKKLESNDVADCRDTKGFHQLDLYSDLVIPFEAYRQLTGIKVVHI